MKYCEIEKIEITHNAMPHNLVTRILCQGELAFVALGSLACVRMLWFRAFRIGRLDYFFGCALSQKDYVYGRQGRKLRDCIQKAFEIPGLKGVIIYASCLDYVAMWDMDSLFYELENPNDIPVRSLYRGPLVKRRFTPVEQYEAILKELNLEENHLVPFETTLGTIPSLPPMAPDFSGITSFLNEVDSDILLLSPGGCKSCIENADGFKENIRADGYGTRFTDVSVVNGCEKYLPASILEKFPKKRPLFLLGSSIVHMTGFDTEYLISELNKRGKQAIYLTSNGFEGCAGAVDQAMLVLGMSCFEKTLERDEHLVLILGYTRLSVGRKTELLPVIRLLEKAGRNVCYLNELITGKGAAVLPGVVWLVSSEGISLAEWMGRQFQIPVIKGRAVSISQEYALARRICQAHPEDFRLIFEGNTLSDSENCIWILGEPVLTAALYEYYKTEENRQNVRALVYVPTVDLKRHYRRLSDDWIYIASCEELTEVVKCGTIVADQLFIRALQSIRPDVAGVPVDFPEISGQLIRDC